MRGCRCVEIDVWDGEPPSSSSSEDEADTAGQKSKKEKREKPELSFRKRLELKFGRKGSPPKDKPKESSAAPEGAGERIQPWRSNSYRAEPRVLHGRDTTDVSTSSC
jgi:hypothetical protein